MVRWHPSGLYGDKPYLYKEEPTRTLKNKVYVNHYDLFTADSFESGTAYSLHLTLEKAEKFKSYNSWWRKGRKPREGYISDVTLDKLVNENNHTVFLSDER